MGSSSFGAEASRSSGFSWSTGAQAVGEQASVVAPRDVESSRMRDGTHVPCVGRWILIHWATREVLIIFLIRMFGRQTKVASTGRCPLMGCVVSLMMLRGTPLLKSISYLALGFLSKLVKTNTYRGLVINLGAGRGA